MPGKVSERQCLERNVRSAPRSLLWAISLYADGLTANSFCGVYFDKDSESRNERLQRGDDAKHNGLTNGHAAAVDGVKALE